ncbi:Uncharacterized protein PHSC3_001764 [Chlamydiales bacterium STE3]|nr:Uncharacterized protein PHSC3_001764 [Chlamydiales bacterium STE3]
MLHRFFSFTLCLISLCFISWNAAPRCFYELQMTFFEKEYVMEALDIYNPANIYQSQWALIYIDLTRARNDIPHQIKENAKKMHPNPLQHPFQSDKAKELFLKTLYEVFAKVIRRHANVNDEAIQGMFNYIIERQSKKLEACFEQKNRSQHRNNRINNVEN